MKTLTKALVPLAFAIACVRAQAPTLILDPASPMPGDIVRITLTGAEPSGGTLAGEPLHFRHVGNEWHAIGGIPVDTSGDVPARAFIRSGGRTDTVVAMFSVPRPTPPKAKAALKVSTTFTKPLDAATQKRIADENARARAVARASHDTPVLWTGAFITPRQSVITSQFGSGREFNGKLSSRHLGVDLRGGLGDTVVAANRGVVVLTAPFFLAGNVVYVSHGGGLVTGYFHLSKTLVAVGDTVARGQPIGLVGATGRVTGPHLHWAARYGGITVNPLDLTRLDPAWYSGMN